MVAPLELSRVGMWLERVPGLLLDGERPTSKALSSVLAAAWRPDQPWADIVTGGGLPKNEHWSFFVVWEMVEYQPDVVTPPDPPIEPPIEPPTGDLAKQVAANTAAIKQLQAWARSFDGEL